MERPEAGHGIASLGLALGAGGLALLARGLTDDWFSIVAGWSAFFAAVGLGLALRGLLARGRRRRAAATGALLNGTVVTVLALSIPACDPAGRSWALLLGAGVLLLVLVLGIALDRRRSRRLCELGRSLGLAPHRHSLRGLRSGARLEIEPERGRVTVSVPGGLCFGFETPTEELLADPEARREFEALGACCRARVACPGPHGPFSASWTVQRVAPAELEGVIDHAAELVRALAARGLELGPVLVEDGGLRVRANRSADWPVFQIGTASEIGSRAPEVSLWLEQERVFHTRIDPLRDEETLAGRWLRLWLAVSDGQVVFNAELFREPWFDRDAEREVVQFRVRALDRSPVPAGTALVPPTSPRLGARTRVCGACARCEEPFTLVHRDGADADVVRCARCDEAIVDAHLGYQHAPVVMERA